MSMNTLEYANQLLAENAQLNAEIGRLKSELSRYSMSPGRADQRMNESRFVRITLGFGADSDDVSPKDLVDAIAVLHEQVRAMAVLAEDLSEFIVNGTELCYIELPMFYDDPATATYQRCLLKPKFAADAAIIDILVQSKCR